MTGQFSDALFAASNDSGHNSRVTVRNFEAFLFKLDTRPNFRQQFVATTKEGNM